MENGFRVCIEVLKYIQIECIEATKKIKDEKEDEIKLKKGKN
jgi:hypothetical protein